MLQPIKAKANDNEYEITPAGVYLARCFRMVDVGTHQVTGQYGTNNVRQVVLAWELLADGDGNKVSTSDGNNYEINKFYTLSMHPKAGLRKDLESWRGKPFTSEEADDFDVTKLLDKYCLLQISHNKSGEKTYANIQSIMSTSKTAKSDTPITAYSVESNDAEEWAKLPEWLQKKCIASQEYNGDGLIVEDDDEIELDGVPF